MTELEQRKAEIEAIILTEDEIKEAIHQARVKKWFNLQHSEYWNTKENAPKTGKITFK